MKTVFFQWEKQLEGLLILFYKVDMIKKRFIRASSCNLLGWLTTYQALKKVIHNLITKYIYHPCFLHVIHCGTAVAFRPIATAEKTMFQQ